jgi:hypothetical protein
VHYQGTFGDATQTVELDVRASRGGNGTGRLDFGRFVFESIGWATRLYFKGDDRFLTLLGPVAAAAKGKHIKAKVTDERWKRFASFTDSDDFLRSLFKPDGTLEVGERKKIGGVDVVGVVSDGGKDGGILWIATRGEPLPVFVEPNAGSTAKGGISFTEWNVPVRATAPPRVTSSRSRR